MLAADRDTGGMNLGIAGVREKSPFLVRAPGRADVAAFGVGRKEKYIAVTTGRQDNGVARVGGNFSRDKVAHNDSFGMAIDDDHIEHLGAREHLDGAKTDLPAKRLIGSKEKLLPRL